MTAEGPAGQDVAAVGAVADPPDHDEIPDVAAVVVTYNSAHVVGELLDSLPAALDGLAARIVVVDNGSSDGTVDLIEARSDIVIVRSANQGYSAGINTGIRAAGQARSILVLNPDVVMRPGSIRLMVEAMSTHRTGIVAPRIEDRDGVLQLSLRREPTLRRALGLSATGLACFSEHVGRTEDYELPRSVDWALGAVLLVSWECHERVGEWDESFFLYSEETDYSMRARERGLLTRYEPRAVAVHIGQQSGHNDLTHSMQIINRVRFYRRRHGAFASTGYLLATVATETGWWLLRGAGQSRTAVIALLSPKRRPPQLGPTGGLLPH